MRTIFIIMDSLNRHYLRCYGNEFAITPNIDRLAQRGTVFDTHFAGSLPCMPARREMLTGEQVQGRSLCHLLAADADHHGAVLYGGFAKDVCLTDGRYRYFRQALPESWVHHHTMMPRGSQDFLAVNRLDVEYGYFLKYPSDRGYAQLRWRQPSEPALDAPDFNLLFDGDTDPGQQHPLRDLAREQRMATLLRDHLAAVEAPDCQYQRLGL